MSGENLIWVENLHRHYGQIKALRGVSFEVRRGEVLGFLGPNGAGKSTTMQIISGTLAPSAGRVLIGGVDILDQPRAAKAQLGYLPEQPPLYRDSTVDEFLSFCAGLRHIPRKRTAAAVADARQRCGLQDVGRRLIGNLSKGYQQRVGIAQAIVHAPAVVILDEPTVGLDPIQIREIRDLIRELGDDHSVILSTHILPEVQAVCDQVQIIHQGRLVLNEPIENLARPRGEQCLRVAFRRPPEIRHLGEVPGVSRLENISDGCLRLYHHPDSDPTEALVAAAVREDWGLFELTPERRTLEEIFVELTCGDEPVSPGEPDAPRASA